MSALDHEPTTIAIAGVGWSAGSTVIIDDIGFTVPARGVTGLIGPNGSGKSTLLHVAGGLRRPTTGAVRLGEDDVHALPGRERARRIGFVEQQSTTDLDLRVRDVVSLGRSPHRGRWPGTDPRGAERVDDAMARTDVAHLADRRWHSLSGGERQRVQIARALAQDPAVLLLDEPTNHLDLRHQLDVMRLVRELKVTTLVAIHDLEVAAAFCDRLAVLDGGRLVAHGEVANVLTAGLLREVFGVTGAVIAHPASGRPHLVWDETA